jgi:hypothetical protein
MVIGLISTIIIAFDFIYGMLSYLLMQICLIISFSGISFISPSVNLNHLELRHNFITSVVFWTIFIPVVFFVFIFNGVESLVVVPYVITIGLIACISWFGLGYNQRSKVFRWMIVAASALFVFSDALIGNANYGQFHIETYLLIDITYVLNILLMSHVILFLNDASSRTPIKT